MVKSMEIIKQIIDLGSASCLTRGAELGWFEYGRPGHPKGYNSPPQKIEFHISNSKEDQ
jgi:hypothetical protein